MKLFLVSMDIIWNRYTRSLVLKILQYLPIHKGRVLCVSWEGKNFSCNPKAIAQELTKKKQFEVWFAFLDPIQSAKDLCDGIKAVEIGSLAYFKILASSQFVIANTRFAGGRFWPFKKKNGQFYIQTMHGPHGVKKVEFAAEQVLPIPYINLAMEDNKRTDLMLTDSVYGTNVCRKAFLYRGEILEKGLPRNDVFYRTTYTSGYKKYLIYAPTFRADEDRSVYNFSVDGVISALEKRFGGEWYIRVSCHPNMLSYYHEIYNFSHPRLIDVGKEELHKYLLNSDALLTDYSSSAMDFMRTGLPIFQLCKDRYNYDRGFFLNPEELPFPYAETEDQLLDNIESFDEKEYQEKLKLFKEKVLGFQENGHASEAVVEWMLNKYKA